MYSCTTWPPTSVSVQDNKSAGWEVAIDLRSKMDIPKSVCVSFAAVPVSWTCFHDVTVESLENDINSRASSVKSVGPFMEDSGAGSNTCQNWNVFAEVSACIQSASWGESWEPDTFQFVQKLQNADCNLGSVDLMQLLLDGSFVAVKRMPRAWTKSGFWQKCGDDCAKLGMVSENCWLDVGLAKYLDKEGVPFVCQPLGVFFSASETFVVSEFATEGDFFNFTSGGPFPGSEREKWLCPLFKQVVDALLWLHDRLIAHCDISLENILVTKDAETGFLQVKLIDYGVAAVGQRLIVGCRGKPSYQAPEMIAGAYDPFRADVFALGVVLYSSAATSYPWISTKPGTCKRFVCAHDNGLLALLRRHKIFKHGKTARIIDTLGGNILVLLHELLAINPRHRVTVRTAKMSEWLQ